MTHKDIFTKFMIEYDKANITSSYPSLTKYEVAVILDKAYNAIIAQKVTGNNIRRSSLEQDIKSVSDLQPLITTSEETYLTHILNKNVVHVNLPEDFLYYVNAFLQKNNTQQWIKLVGHITANKFIVSDTNLPWVNNPVAYIEGNKLYVVYDYSDKDKLHSVSISYIKQPELFLKQSEQEMFSEDSLFECNDTVADELVSLAVVFALENIESQRLLSKIGIKGLES